VPKVLRMLTALVTALGLLGLGVVSAEATSGAHFMPDTSASVTDNGALSIFIDEAGVGQATVNYNIVWSGTADYGCINGGGNHPQASNKETVSSGGAATFSFSPINGRVMATALVPGTPPPAPSTFSCPSGQTLVLADVSYTTTVTDTTNGNVSITLSASRTFFTFKK
jgi:hypothetical protein